MNNQPKIEAYKSFFQQGKDYVNAGNIPAARDAFLRAAELANDIALGAKSYDTRMQYSKLANAILDYVRNECVVRPVGDDSEPAMPSADGPNTDGNSRSGSGQRRGSSGTRRSSGSTQSDGDNEFTPENISDENRITFADVAGLQDVKDEIRFKVIAPMQRPDIAEKYNISAGAKILMYGPPGTGKTYIGRAIAGEVDAKFFYVRCSALIDKYMGESSKKLERLFDAAEKYDRAIIFFDEFDSVASKRGDGSGGVDAEMARFVATFLAKVDGFKPSGNKMLLLIAATNRPWVIDSAMVRGGRFDTHIYVGLPDQEAREFLVNKALKDIARDDDVDLSKLAWALEGYGGGDITSICKSIRSEPYKREILTGQPQHITRDDCNKILSASHRTVTQEELDKFARYKEGNDGIQD